MGDSKASFEHPEPDWSMILDAKKEGNSRKPDRDRIIEEVKNKVSGLKPFEKTELGKNSGKEVNRSVKKFLEMVKKPLVDLYTYKVYGFRFPDRWSRVFTENFMLKFEYHDQREVNRAYKASGIDRSLTYTHVPVKDRIKAGFAYCDALFLKDEVEQKYRLEDGTLSSRKMFDNDGLNEEKINFYYNTSRDYELNFEKEALGEWQKVFEAFYTEYKLLVEPFFKDERKELAILGALIETLAFRRHKIGRHTDRRSTDLYTYNYSELYGRAVNIKMHAALQKARYPEKHSNDGYGGVGSLPELYQTFVEIHDEYRQENKNHLRSSALLMGAEFFNQFRKLKY